MLKSWCRDAANHQFSFRAEASTCWATEALERYRRTDAFQKLAEPTQSATQLAARFREGKHPDLLAGLDLEDAD